LEKDLSQRLGLRTCHMVGLAERGEDASERLGVLLDLGWLEGLVAGFVASLLGFFEDYEYFYQLLYYNLGFGFI